MIGRACQDMLTRMLEPLLHRRTPDTPTWRYLPLILAAAFALRAAIALLSDFTLHPDEIMQYLEPAHQLVFGNGILHWEFYYGARSWLLPGLSACILKLFDLAGLGEPYWYIPGVKLAFCALSLAIPAAMYYFARWHFSELSARIALLAGTFWYELIGFAHKPMSEFIATALLMVLLALCVRPTVNRAGTVWLAAALAVLGAGVRVQYAPIALLLLGVVFLRCDRKGLLLLAATLLFLALGLFDALTWSGGLFHSYVTYLIYHLYYEFPAYTGLFISLYRFLQLLALSSAVVGLLCLLTALRWPRRYGLLIVLIAIVLLFHALQKHQAYRFVFFMMPLWLLIGSDLLARIHVQIQPPGRLAAALAVLFMAISSAGILNTLPYQDLVYRSAFSRHQTIRFLRDQPPLFAAYRYLARAPGVRAVWHANRHYSVTPGYYYLHRKVPFYDSQTAQSFLEAPFYDLRDAQRLIRGRHDMLWRTVSHIVVSNEDFSPPGYSLEKTFGTIRILRRDHDALPVREWQTYKLVKVAQDAGRTVRKAGIDDEPPAPDAGVHFTSLQPPGTQYPEPAP